MRILIRTPKLKSVVDRDQLEIVETPANTDDDAVEGREDEV